MTAKIYAPSETPAVETTPVPLPGALTHLYFSETGSYFERVQYYEFYAENGAYTVYFWMAHEEEPYLVAVDQAWVDTLTEIVRRNGMILWDGFRGHSYGLLDGTNFSTTLTFSDGTSVNASGYGEMPAGYGAASNAIDAHFMNLLPEDMRDW